MCDVVTVAKRDLKAGQTLDGIGGFDAYGTIENADVSQANDFLPMSLSGGCRLTRGIAHGEVITYADVTLPANRLCDQLRSEQNALFFSKAESNAQRTWAAPATTSK